MIFCLGLILFPKQNFYVQTFEPEQCCCKNSKKNCCDSRKENPKKDCKSDCNSTCHKVNNSPNIFVLKSENQELTCENPVSKKQNFIYANPYFSSLFKEIWQPPKIFGC
jgi:hypothetical protein